MTSLDALAKVAEAYDKASKARVELVAAIKEARAAGHSLRQISVQSGYSHEQIRQITST